VKGKEYDYFHLVAIQGWSNVKTINLALYIWVSWGLTNDNNRNRRDLKAMIIEWSEGERFEIDEGIHFGDKQLDILISLDMGFGDETALFINCGCGNSIVACTQRDKSEMAAARAMDAVEAATEGTRTYSEALALTKGAPRAPPSNFGDLKLCIATFAALQYALFTAKCLFYRNVVRIRRMFKNKQCFKK